VRFFKAYRTKNIPNKMRCAQAQRIYIGYSPCLNQYPWQVAPQQSSLPFPDKRMQIILFLVYLQPVLKMGRLHYRHFKISLSQNATSNLPWGISEEGIHH